MIQLTEWIPDTCKCRMVMAWDDAVPVEERVHTIEVMNPCEFHLSEPDKQVAFDKVQEENRRKNDFVRQVFDNFPSLRDEASGGRALKEGAVNWEFDAERNLKVEVPELTQEDLAVLETKLSEDPKIDDTRVQLGRSK